MPQAGPPQVAGAWAAVAPRMQLALGALIAPVALMVSLAVSLVSDLSMAMRLYVCESVALAVGASMALFLLARRRSVPGALGASLGMLAVVAVITLVLLLRFTTIPRYP